MTREEQIEHNFLVRHQDADVLVFDEETKLPIEARYFSGFTTKQQREAQQQREADLKTFLTMVAALQSSEEQDVG